MFRIAFTIWSSFWTCQKLRRSYRYHPGNNKYYQYWPSPWTRLIGHIPPGRLRGLRLRGRFPDDHLSQPASGLDGLAQGKTPGSLLFVLHHLWDTQWYIDSDVLQSNFIHFICVKLIMTSLRPNPGIIVSKGNHPQMAATFRWNIIIYPDLWDTQWYIDKYMYVLIISIHV